MPNSNYADLEGQSVLVNLKSGDALRGTVRDVGAAHIDLGAGTQLIGSEREPFTLDGEGLVIPDHSIDFVQVLGR